MRLSPQVSADSMTRRFVLINTLVMSLRAQGDLTLAPFFIVQIN